MAYKPSGDKVLFFTAGFLLIFGLVMVYSASSIRAAQKFGDSSYYFLPQLMYAGIGLTFLLVLTKMNYRIWQKPKILLILVSSSLLLLLFVYTQPELNGAHRWLRFGKLSFQPSEIAKLVGLMFAAWYLQKYESEINQPIRRLLPLGLVIGLFARLIAKEPDLGQAVCLCLIVAIMLFVAGLSWRYFAGAIILAIPAFYFFVVNSRFRWGRMQVFLDPFHDPMGYGWQIRNSLIAIGSGGISGLGLGAGKHKLYWVPEAPSDFIYTVIGEEIGLIGTSLVVLAFLVYFYRGMRVVLRSQDRFGFYLGLGITLMVVMQGFINISMVLSMMPTKGIALPFMSQGGSSLLLNLMATGVLLNLSYQNKLGEAAE